MIIFNKTIRVFLKDQNIYLNIIYKCMKNQNHFLTIFILFAVLISCTKKNNDNLVVSQSNILFIAIDDMKPTLGCYGDLSTFTPHMDKLAEQGTVFLNAHCQEALCGPSRTSLLLGLYPDQTLIWDFSRKFRNIYPDIVTLPQHFGNNDYTAIGVGKVCDYRNVDQYEDSLSWSETSFPHGNNASPYFNENSGPLVGHFYQPPLVKKKFNDLKPEAEAAGINPVTYLHRHIKPSTECIDLPDDAYIDGVFAERAVEEMKRLAVQDQPFFLAVGFHRPHLPFTAPKKYWDLYKREDMEISEIQGMAENDVAYAYNTSGHLRSYSDEEGNFIYDTLKSGGTLPVNEQKKLIHGYKAAVTYIDTQVGKILSTLEELQLTDKTIIVLWGDHGFHLGDHNIWGKTTNFEQATRSPLIIAMPSHIPYKTETPVEFVDIYPTLCELAGLDVPDHLAGESLVDLIKGNEKLQDPYAFSQIMRGAMMGYAIRDERYRYVEWIEKGPHVDPDADFSKVVGRQFFDYKHDPLETINYAGSEEYKDVLEKLTRRMHQFYGEMND